MCTVFGYMGETDIGIGRAIWTYTLEHSKHRGRDAFGFERWDSPIQMMLCNRRATPTTEIDKDFRTQPYDGVVHNGTLANSVELGEKPGEIDSEVLPRVLDRRDLVSFQQSLLRVKGSYAIAARSFDGSDIFLGVNYKPLWIRYGNCWKIFSSLKSDLVSPTELPGPQPYRVPPYSVMSLATGESISIPREQPNAALVVCSSGLDSTTAASIACRTHERVRLLHFDYGCRATSKEIECIKKIAKYLNDEYGNCDYVILPIDYTKMSNSTLFDPNADIARGITGVEWSFEWVPARNTVMLAMATAYAESNKFGYIYLGNNLEESGSFADNEEQFILDFNDMLYGAVQDGYKVEIVQPLGHLMKHEIVKLGMEMGTPYHLTWSCYRSGEKHCGCCGPDMMRYIAFQRNGLVDPVPYEIPVDPKLR